MRAREAWVSRARPLSEGWHYRPAAIDVPRRNGRCPAPADELAKHALDALTVSELKARRRELEHAIKGISADAPVQADLRRGLDDVIAEEESRARITDV